MAEPVKYKRQLRSILIHKPLQREYSILMAAIMMASTLLVAMIINGTMRQAVLGSPYHIGKVSPYEMLSTLNQQLVTRVSLTLLAAVVVATVIGIFFLHRVAGPVYRFQMLLKKLSGGTIPNNVQLRENDYFKEVAVEFNNVFKSLRDKKMMAGEAATLLEQLKMDGLSLETRTIIERAKESLRKV